MSRKRHSVDQIIGKLRQADVELGQGKTVEEACRALEITVQTYYRWRQKYGGMQPAMAKQLKALQKENSRLKKVVADQVLDMEILREAAQGNWQAPGELRRSRKFVVVWGRIGCRNVVFAGFWSNLAARTVTNVGHVRAKRGTGVCCWRCVGSVERIRVTEFLGSTGS